MPNNEPSSEQRDNTLSRFKKWFREKYPRVYGFFVSETPIYIRHFFGFLVSLGILGGFLALTVPLWKSWNSIPFLGVLIPTASTDYSEPKAIADLRLHILYITGGIIAILTLLQTNWKNQIDRRKVEDDIQKNKNDHVRELHAERRSRYTKAVEQLANEKASVRLGGIYTLVGLVDEWVADDALKSEEAQKEGQAIINSLCAYIRSPFPLASKRTTLESLIGSKDYAGDFEQDRTILRDEREIRRAIFEEISNRLKNSAGDITSKIWSSFTFNLNGADVFYPLNRLTFGEINFSYSNFYGYTNFSESIFKFKANFANSNFDGETNFSNARFRNISQFSGSTFVYNSKFTNTHFRGPAHFTFTKLEDTNKTLEWELGGPGTKIQTTFGGDVDFSNSVFEDEANFSEAKFSEEAKFSSTKIKDGTFREARFRGKSLFDDSIFNQHVSFFGSKFGDPADFLRAQFKEGASFENSTFGFPSHPNAEFKFNRTYFGKNSTFSVSTFYGGAIFKGATFVDTTSFYKTRFFNEVNFYNINSKPQENPKKNKDIDAKLTFIRASFGYPSVHDFRFENNSKSLIDMGVVNLLLLDGRTIQVFIPVDSYLFDSGSWDEENQKYTIKSDAAIPINMQDRIFHNMNITFP
ncbi:pentapeptide repeat-containing protein [uncultured Rothia sp.]|uniref:pentapeptide repeat-containing protein n=1 Tax=uncultured Rothia sp. TaxID=316088 RepID=UPI0028F0EFBC|nr:pentapeptide repeat-containing protein [uncultured Rothia sp.]